MFGSCYHRVVIGKGGDGAEGVWTEARRSRKGTATGAGIGSTDMEGEAVGCSKAEGKGRKACDNGTEDMGGIGRNAG